MTVSSARSEQRSVKEIATRWLSDPRLWVVIVTVLALAASLGKSGHANNWRIFRFSFFDLLAGENLYALHPGMYADYFKYSPTFALAMGPLAFLPEGAGAIVWNLINALAFFCAVQALPWPRSARAMILGLTTIELLISLQNFQSNALVAALIIGAFASFERGFTKVAAICLVSCAFIKIFGAAGGLLFLFYPRKRAFLITAVVVALLLFIAPVAVISAQHLTEQYRNWFELLRADYNPIQKLSLMAGLRAWFGMRVPDFVVQVLGLIALLLPLAIWRNARDLVFKGSFLASLLLFLVIFNHKAESPMFVLAVSGVAIWYVARPQSGWTTGLVLFVFVVTSLFSTDLIPRHIRSTILAPLAVKLIPCLIAWVVIEAQLLRRRAVASTTPILSVE